MIKSYMHGAVNEFTPLCTTNAITLVFSVASQIVK